MAKTHPHTISNGAGEELTFLRLVRDADGERLEAEGLGCEVLGEPPRIVEPGETAIFAPGVPHRWWNAGQTELRTTGWAKPPDNIEFFLSALFESMMQNGGKRPGLSDIAYLVIRYRSEFRTYVVPLPVQRVLFPIVLTIGHALGKYRKFKDAPPPVRRAAEARSAPN
jgi:hypothetical protein